MLCYRLACCVWYVLTLRDGKIQIEIRILIFFTKFTAASYWPLLFIQTASVHIFFLYQLRKMHFNIIRSSPLTIPRYALLFQFFLTKVQEPR